MSSLLTVHNLQFIRNKPVLKNISFKLQAGHRLAIAGETGSGKSTLLKIIAGLEQATSGEVLLNHVRVKGPADQLVPGHAQIAYLSQHFELPRFLRVEQILEYANKLSEKTANRIFSICQINHLMQRKTHELSGGEKQRIAIARLLIQQPQLLLLDEPYAHLDIPLKKILKQVVDAIGGKLKISCILVSHDPYDTLPWASEIIVLKKGEVLQRGTPQQIYQLPTNEYVAALFGHYTVVDKTWIKKLGIKTTRKKYFLRPENLPIVKKTKKSFAATVTNSLYFGDRVGVNVETTRGSGKKKSFLVQAQGANYNTGQLVWIEYKA